ncbi:MAG TPA: tRNA (adenosine(37)-N6)-dimethylallyltransferase MiaA [Candidatus Peribacteria bacterium]|nr:tRNA (adenosine(37)-N6)-dimethylallyltransferase MiaA [Candidatus Peribacteria bacterium]
MHPLDTALDFLATAKRPLLVVLGPTASGKTAFSVELALALTQAGNTLEIINADSRQLYKGMDIGTAKITAEEMKGVPHLLFSVIDPSEEITAATYQRMATETIEAVQARGNVPMLVGGSMLYISSVIDGLQPLPAKDDALRAELEAAYAKDDGVSLFAELSDIDPESAKIIPRENRPYVIRAVEIHRLTGKPKSAQLTVSSCPYDLLIFGMQWPRAELTARIDKRTPLLLRGGWIDEVKRLLAEGYTLESPGMKSHGYPEMAKAILDGVDPLSAEPVIAAKTRQYAKRQMTWWKHDKRIHWIRPT